MDGLSACDVLPCLNQAVTKSEICCLCRGREAGEEAATLDAPGDQQALQNGTRTAQLASLAEQADIKYVYSAAQQCYELKCSAQLAPFCAHANVWHVEVLCLSMGTAYAICTAGKLAVL